MIQKIKSFGLATIFLVSAITAEAQLKVPAPSPLQTVKQAFALSEITIEYSRPSAKGRVIFGDVVPFGKVWRTGANGSTKITFGEDVTVSGNAVAAGTYAIYSIPNKDSWEIMLYKDLKMGGDVASYKVEDEVTRFVVKTKPVNEKVETFSIDLANMTSASVDVQLVWENTRVSFVVKADIDAKIMKSIDGALAKDTRPYYQAASYYYESGKDMVKALEWVNKATEQNPKGYWVFLLKAKIQSKAGDKTGAVATAQQVIALAKEDKNDDYVKMAEKLIAENKK